MIDTILNTGFFIYAFFAYLLFLIVGLYLLRNLKYADNVHQLYKQKSLIDNSTAGGACWNRIALATQQAFYKKLHIFSPRYTFGILIHHPESVEIHTFSKQTITKFRFARHNLNIEWLGCKIALGRSLIYALKLTQGDQQLIIGSNVFEDACDLCRMLKSDFVLDPKVKKENFWPSRLVLEISLLLLMLGFIGKTWIISYFFINSANLITGVLFVALNGSLVVYWLLKRYATPAIEASAVTLMFCLSFYVFLWTALQCLDQYLPGAKSGIYEYHYAGNDGYVPQVANTPQIKLALSSTAKKIGEPRSFALLHGALGSWQADLLAKAKDSKAYLFTPWFSRLQLNMQDDAKIRTFITFQLPIGIALPLLFFIINRYAERKQQRMLQGQNQLAANLKDPEVYWWERIKVATPKFYKRHFWHAFKFNGYGLLIHHADDFEIRAKLGDRFCRFIYPKQQLKIKRMGSLLVKEMIHGLKLGEGESELIFSANTVQRTSDIAAMLDRSPQSNQMAGTFALEKNKASLSVTILFLVLFVGAFIDGIVINQFYLMTTFELIAWSIFPALVIGFGCHFLLRSHAVPKPEAQALAMMMTMAVLAAIVPIAQRVDQFSPGAHRDFYEFRHQGHGEFDPLDQTMPHLSLYESKEYWEQFPVGSIHHFEFLRGSLGLLQFNEAELAEKYKQFYQHKPVR